MKIRFSKYHGAGNDFVLIDNRKNFFPVNDSSLIERLCNRRTGVGADGVLLLELSQVADYKMRIFNADGSQPSMCGNGIRCLIDFLIGFDNTVDFEIEICNRILKCRKFENTIGVNLGMPQVSHWPIELALDTGKVQAYILNTGVPHAVIFVENILEMPFLNVAQEVRWHSAFLSEGVNVNFAQIDADAAIMVRTYERGVEGETLACGTGAAAVAWTAMQLHGLNEPISIKTRSSMQNISFHKSMLFSFPCSSEGEKSIEMLGSAQFVFSGEMNL
jgi:diaminopimelate epimerase